MLQTIILVFVVTIVVLILASPVIGLLILMRLRRKKERAAVPNRRNEYVDLDVIYTNKYIVVSRIIPVMLVLIYCCQIFFPVIPSKEFFNPTSATNYVFGSLNKDWVFEGKEWYRIISSAFLHGNLLHIILNSVFFLLCGSLLEKIVGSYWFLLIFFVSTISGSIISMELHNTHVASVGVSGALMGIIAATIIISSGMKNHFWRDNIQIKSLQILIPSLIPTVEKVDYAGHFGGMVGGIVLGLLIKIIYHDDTQVIYLSKNITLKLAAFLSVLAVIAAIGMVLLNFSANAEMVKALVAKQ